MNPYAPADMTPSERAEAARVCARDVYGIRLDDQVTFTWEGEHHTGSVYLFDAMRTVQIGTVEMYALVQVSERERLLVPLRILQVCP